MDRLGWYVERRSKRSKGGNVHRVVMLFVRY